MRGYYHLGELNIHLSIITMSKSTDLDAFLIDNFTARDGRGLYLILNFYLHTVYMLLPDLLCEFYVGNGASIMALMTM